MTKAKLLSAFIAIASLGVLAPRPAQAADISIDVYDSFITSKIDSAINGYIQSNVSSFSWLQNVVHVETHASGSGSNFLHVTLNVTYRATLFGQPFDVPVDIDFDVLFDCGEGGPYALLDNTAIHTLVAVPQGIATAIEAAANTMLLAKEQAIITPLWARLGTLPNIASIHQVCPHFVVSAGGDVHAEVDFVRGCINDRTRHRNCGFHQIGDGYDYVCDNGYWTALGGWCEPGAPPGGQQP